ncbi:MAG: hypothetical protein Q8P34_14025 [Bacteroidota bacterium]|nr:hypothetical protein [Bacteroidota bacterium]
MKDLIILVADQNMRDCIEGLIPKLPHALNITSFTYDIFVHTNRDPGCRTQSPAFLVSFQNKYRFGLVIFDKEGCGQESISRVELEENVESSLFITGWKDRARTIVIEPELENWIWVRSAQLAEIINWDNIDSLYQWLADEKYLTNDSPKPKHPKEAFEAALYISRKRRSSSVYKQIASRVSFKSCTDQSFLKFIQCMKDWFPSEV